MKIQLSLAKSNDDWPPVDVPKSAKTSALYPPTDMPKHRTMTSDIFPKFVMPEDKPKTFVDIFKPFWDQELEKVRSQPRVKQLYKEDGIDVEKYKDPKYGFFGESFARMLNAERNRIGSKEHADAQKEA